MLKNGKRYNLTLNHGSNQRIIPNALVRSFEQDGETRWEAESDEYPLEPNPYETHSPGKTHIIIGFLPENVVEATPIE